MMAGSEQGVTVTIELGQNEPLGAHLLARMDGVDDRDVAGFDGVLGPRARASRGARRRVRAALVVDRLYRQQPAVGLDAPAVAPGGARDVPAVVALSSYFGPARRRALGAALFVFGVFVLVGYVNPITWTGFRGQTLWSWLTLIILPVSIITVRVWPQTGRDLHRGHIAGATVLCAALVTTIIGGYWAGWSWTGYEGSTLWDWLTLVLAPAAVTTILVPALGRLLTRAADEPADRDRERAAHELALRAARERVAQR
jgi:hypothetical protein